MKKITDFKKIGKPGFDEIRAKVDEAIQAIGKEYGCDIKAGGISYDSGSMTLKVQMSVINENGMAESKFSAAWRDYASSFGLDPNLLFTTVKNGIQEFMIVGLNPNAHKSAVHLKDVKDGKGYTTTIAALNQWIARKQPAAKV